nr:indolepyruvate oxidoreductase subunit beta family protein [Caldimonas sp.]
MPIKIAILAMGGEGGGVLADWIVDLGEANGWLAQTTSVPGVAQRTGATIYYVELYPGDAAERDGADPVLALMPLPGDVDVVLASELMECGRAVQRGLVTPDRTTLIASTHRVYSITEKTAMGDGRVSSDALLAHARSAAKRFVRFDMAAAAEESGSVISAVLFGALAGTGVLPFSRAQFEATIARGGVGVGPSLKAFDAAFARAAGAADNEGALFDAAEEPGTTTAAHGSTVAAPAASALDGTTDAPSTAGILRSAHDDSSEHRHPEERSEGSRPPAIHPDVRALLDRIAAFPPHAHMVLREGVRRLIDYQDPAYAALYLDRVARVAAAPQDTAGQLVAETARHLALWMAYEDTVRV